MGESTRSAPGKSRTGEVEHAAAVAPVDEWRQWRDKRQEFLTSKTGWPALVSYQKLTPDRSRIEQIPAFVQLAESGNGALLTADRDAGVFVDGRQVDGTVLVERLGPEGSPVVSCGRFSFEVFSLDGKDYELRVYDEAGENRARFERVLTYDYDPLMVLPARLVRSSEEEEVPWEFTRAEDTGHSKRVPATIEVGYAGQLYELAPFRDGPALVITFADATTGVESYTPGRFLRFVPPNETDEVHLDFNRAFIPPCGFSNFYSCPVPPPQNRLPIDIRAGERRALWRSGPLES